MILIEVPHTLPDLERAFAAVDQEDCWDGFAIDGTVTSGVEGWEDLIDSVRTPWKWLLSCLPDDIAGRLCEIDARTRLQFIEHVGSTIHRSASLNLTAASIDLAVDRLAWPDVSADIVKVGTELNKRAKLLEELVRRGQVLGVRMCLSLRLPLPSVASGAGELAMKLISKVGNSNCRLLLTIMVEELKTYDPAEVLGPYVGVLGGIRLRYEPRLGWKPTPRMEKEWPAYLQAHGFQGALIFSPRHEELSGFEAELQRLARAVPISWRR